MEKTTSILMAAVDRERVSLQMSDAQFSRRVLGISPSYLCRLKNGERAITLDLLTLFMQKLPRVTPVVMTYIMSQGDGDNPSPVTQNPVASDTPPATPAKSMGQPTSDYLGHGNHPKTRGKPSKKATGH